MLKEIIKIGNKFYINANIVMLPANKKAPIILMNMIEEPKIILRGYNLDTNYGNDIPQHMYITSNEEIKVGDWYLNDYRDNIHQNNGNPIWVLKQCTSIFNKWIGADNHEEVGYNPDWSKKIIATTDKLPLEPYQGHFEGIDCTNYVPQLSQEFIEKYIEAYNKGNIITDVLVECEYIKTPTRIFYSNDVLYEYDRIKINPKTTLLLLKK